MRIGLLTASLSRRGGNLFATLSALGRSLHQLPEIDIAAFGLRDEMTDSDVAAWGTLKVTAAQVRGPSKFGFSRELDSALAQADLDLLHVHGLWTYTSVASRRWADATARPYIITPHGMLDPWAVRQKWWRKLGAGVLFELAHLRGAACLQARCEAEVGALRALKLRNPICVIPNPVEPAPERSSGPIRLSSLDRAGGRVLLCPLLVNGHVQTLLSAWQQARLRTAGREFDWSLVLVGSEAERDALTRKCASLGIQKTVRFLTPASAAISPALWEAATAVVLLPAASEQTMNAVRAWSHGLSVLLCDAGSASVHLCAGAALTTQATIESLADGLATLVGMSQAEHAAMGSTARRLIQARLAPAAAADEMARVYRWILGHGPRPACVLEH
jgi:poly(glycerol-phosphate) alpha-glucosyltransferase